MGESRRTFLTVAGLAGATLVADLAGARRAGAQTGTARAPLLVQTPALTIAYEDTGDGQGFPVLLLHGFPDDVRAWDDVVPPLVRAGYRVVVPYLRGC